MSCARCGHADHKPKGPECWTTCLKCAEALAAERRKPIAEREAESILSALKEEPEPARVCPLCHQPLNPAVR